MRQRGRRESPGRIHVQPVVDADNPFGCPATAEDTIALRDHDAVAERVQTNVTPWAATSNGIYRSSDQGSVKIDPGPFQQR
jgi:hypothetical protein